MCGRYSLSVTLESFIEAFPQVNIAMDPGDYFPRYNIAPTQPIPVVTNDGKMTLDYHHWGLIPSWAKDKKFASRMINARGETLGEKPAFRTAYRKRRCIIPADGFFEWVKIKGYEKKVPIYIQMKTKKPFAFAGLWETWTSPEGETIPSATIITTEPNELVAEIHQRMPAILPKEAYDLWLDPAEKAPEDLADLIKPYPAAEMQQYPVTTMINSPRNEGPEIIAPLQTLF